MLKEFKFQCNMLRRRPSVIFSTYCVANSIAVQYVTKSSANPITYDVTLANFPHLEIQTVNSEFIFEKQAYRAVIGNQGPVWFFASLIVNFVIGLGQIVSEKELNLRSAMQIMGLYVSGT